MEVCTVSHVCDLNSDAILYLTKVHLLAQYFQYKTVIKELQCSKDLEKNKKKSKTILADALLDHWNWSRIKHHWPKRIFPKLRTNLRNVLRTSFHNFVCHLMDKKTHWTLYLPLVLNQMVKMIKDLKKDNEFLKSKCEKSDIAIVKLIEEVLNHLYKLFWISWF